MDRIAELQHKVLSLRQWLSNSGYDCVVLNKRPNFAWITGGGQNYVWAAGEGGVGSVVVTGERLILLADNIEIARLAEEELPEIASQFELVDYPWWEPGAVDAQLKEITHGSVFADDGGNGGVDQSAQIASLRFQLLPVEQERYLAIGRDTTKVLESVCRDARPGMREHDIAGMMFERAATYGLRVPVYLVAGEDRILNRRHPIVTDEKIDDRLMVVICAEREGLIANATRLVNFKPLDAELKIKHVACCHVDAAAIAATQPGTKFSEIFKVIQDEYAHQGFEGEWKLHHQGGSTGYMGRDAFANPVCDETVYMNQGYAWNPSITGTKSEDSFIVTPSGPKFVTAPGDDWPCVEIERDGLKLKRADILDLS